MLKKLSALFLATLMLFLCACGEKDTVSEPTDTNDSSVAEDFDVINPLTGMQGIAAEDANERPVAIMINNFKSAQAVQTGLTKADIIYETEVEGGITRLLAVFQDVEAVPTIGTVRSARYPYIDLADGHNAIFVHEGQDPTYAKPHLRDVDAISLENAGLGKRMSNGLSSEHTLYTEGAKLWAGLEKKFDTKNDSTNAWVSFVSETEDISFPETPATSVSVPFSNSYKTGFTYDSASKLYTRLTGGNVWHDYKTGESLQVKNVFVLLTKISNYPDGKHRKVDLSSGDGYYVSNGTYTFIKWSKGASGNGFKFTDTEGKELKVNAGSSYVCIADNKTVPTFE